MYMHWSPGLCEMCTKRVCIWKWVNAIPTAYDLTWLPCILLKLWWPFFKNFCHQLYASLYLFPVPLRVPQTEDWDRLYGGQSQTLPKPIPKSAPGKGYSPDHTPHTGRDKNPKRQFSGKPTSTEESPEKFAGQGTHVYMLNHFSIWRN